MHLVVKFLKGCKIALWHYPKGFIQLNSVLTWPYVDISEEVA